MGPILLNNLPGIDHDLKSASSARRGGIKVGDYGHVVEVASICTLIHGLVIGVEGVGSIAPGVQSPTRCPRSQAGAIRTCTCFAYGLPQQVGVGSPCLRGQHAPPLGQIPHSFGTHKRPPIPQPQRVLHRAIIVEDAPVPLKVARINTLGILI